MKPFIIIESPFAGDFAKNRKYANACLRDSLMRGEVPFASHVIYTEALDDTIPFERKVGIEAGLVIGAYASKTVVYTDLGISKGMKYGIDRAIAENRPIEYRTIKPTSFDGLINHRLFKNFEKERSMQPC